MKNNWYEFKAIADDSAEVFIYDEIGGWGITAGQFISDLKTQKGKALTVRIHSPGGSVLDGHAIFNALMRHKGGVTVQIDGLAASMASAIAMSGKPVKMAENAFLMIHNPTGGIYGGSDDMRKGADLLDKMKDGLVNIYAQKSGKAADVIEEAMAEETWFSAKEAKEYGLVDEITDSLELAASFDLSKFSKAPAALVDSRGNNMDLDTLKAELATAQEKHNLAAAQAQKNFADYTAAIVERDAFKADLETAKAVMASLGRELDEAKAKFEEAKAATAEKVNDEATRLLASTGHPQPITSADNGKSNASEPDILAQFNAITCPKERVKFYRANKAAYDAAFSKQNSQ